MAIVVVDVLKKAICQKPETLVEKRGCNNSSRKTQPQARHDKIGTMAKRVVAKFMIVS